MVSNQLHATAKLKREVFDAGFDFGKATDSGRIRDSQKTVSYKAAAFGLN